MLSRRKFLKLGLAGGAGAFLVERLSKLENVFAAPVVIQFKPRAESAPQTPLDGSTILQFVDPVPNLLDPNHLIVDNGSPIELEMREQKAMVLPAGAVNGYAGTFVWSYLKPGQATRTSYLGPVVLATRGKPTEMKFVNNLGTTASTNVLAYKYSTDQTLHWADPLNQELNMFNNMAGFPDYLSPAAQNYDGPIPAAVHLHGGEVPAVLDGGPDSWFTSDGLRIGHGFYSKDGNTPKNYAIYRYPNSQEGALIWFHDHTLGATRLNVYCGLAGGYLIADPHDYLLANSLNNKPGGLPSLFPLVIQDRMFDTAGQLYFPADSAAINPEHPYWLPEFVGDVIVVNGKSWPYMEVQPKRYTFMIVNGSNARPYTMSLVDEASGNPGPALWVIGTDGGYLDKPVKIDPTAAANNALTMMSGERYWVIVDFKGYEAGVQGPNGKPYSGKWLLKNIANTPYPAGDPADPLTVGRIMQFRVAGQPVTDTSFNPAGRQAANRLRFLNPLVRLTNAKIQKKRQLTLNEVMAMPKSVINPVTGLLTDYPGGPLEVLVNNTRWGGERIVGVGEGGMQIREPIPGFTKDASGPYYLSELPIEGETEMWEIVNLTADAHPIHLHLVQFQLLNRQDFNTGNYTVAYEAAFPVGYDFVTATHVDGGVFIPAFGPPLDYTTGNPRALGGNPDITPHLLGPAQPPLPQEGGWKDTVIMLPGQVTRILVRWAPTHLPAITPELMAVYPFDPNDGYGYVWHCHIVDHEDNEMMRPLSVVAKRRFRRRYQKGVDY